MGCNPCSTPDPPQAPPPAETAQAQTQSNLQTAIANARLNRVNQSTPWGSITYTEGPVDANGVPTYSSNIQLSPEQQQLLNQQQAMQLQRGTLAQNLLNQSGNALSQPLNLSNLTPVNNRGNMYTGAISANARQMPNMAPGGMSDNARMLQGIQGAAGQMGNSLTGAVGQAAGPMAQLMQVLMSNPQMLQQLRGALGGQSTTAANPGQSSVGGQMVSPVESTQAQKLAEMVRGR